MSRLEMRLAMMGIHPGTSERFFAREADNIKDLPHCDKHEIHNMLCDECVLRKVEQDETT